MADNAECVVVRLEAVILLEYHFRGHVARSARGFVRVLPLVRLCDSEIGYLDVPLATEHKVFWLDVSMNNIVLVDVLQRYHHARDDEAALVLIELDPLPQVVPEITTRHQVADEVDVVTILEGVLHIHDERVTELGEELPLSHNGVQGPPAHNPRLLHLLEGEECFGFLVLHFPDFAEAASADAVHEVEVLGVDELLLDGSRLRNGVLSTFTGVRGQVSHVLLFKFF